MVRVLVLADTHVGAAPNGALDRLVGALHSELRRADAILHAGDVTTTEVLDALGRYAPVHAVLGNNDHDLLGVLPETKELELGGVAVALVHDSGPREGRAARMNRRFPGARVVVYGHSHQPEDAEGLDGQRLFNPGSPTQRRRAPARTFGVLHLTRGRITGHRIVDLPAARVR